MRSRVWFWHYPQAKDDQWQRGRGYSLVALLVPACKVVFGGGAFAGRHAHSLLPPCPVASGATALILGISTAVPSVHLLPWRPVPSPWVSSGSLFRKHPAPDIPTPHTHVILLAPFCQLPLSVCFVLWFVRDHMALGSGLCHLPWLRGWKC